MCISTSKIEAKENDNVTEVKIYVQGKLLEADDFIIKGERTFLPLRLIGESLGYEVKYNNETQEIVLTNTSKTIQMKLGQKSYTINEKNLVMDVVPFVNNSKTYVPVRFIAESFEEPVFWDKINKTVIVSNYIKPNLNLGKELEFKTNSFIFSIQCNEKFNENISYSLEKDSVVFYDLFNKKESKDNSSGALLSIIKSKSPQTVYVPGILLCYSNGEYIEAVFESGVEYSIASNEFYEKYEESKNLLIQALKTFKLKK